MEYINSGESETKEQEEKETLRRWISEFQLDFKHHVKWAEIKKVWEQFYDGEQLTDKEKKALRDRGQPEVVINQIKPKIDGAIGDLLGKRTMMRAFDKGSMDFETAKHITEALRYIQDRNRFDEVEAEVAEDLFIEGQGWYKVSLEFSDLEPEPKISRRSNDQIILDRKCRMRDLSDAKQLWETVWISMGDLIEMYPQKENEIRSAMSKPDGSFFKALTRWTSSVGDDYDKNQSWSAVAPGMQYEYETFCDKKSQSIRVTNVYERRRIREVFAYHSEMKEKSEDITDYTEEDLSYLESNYPGYKTYTVLRTELDSGIFIGNSILEHKKNIRSYDDQGKFPFIRAVAFQTRGSDSHPYGMVKQYIDAQSEYNKRRSKLLHKLNSSRVIMDHGAVADIEVLRREVVRPDGVVQKKQGHELQVDNGQVGQPDIYMLELSKGEIQDTGVTPEFAGQEDKVLSGYAISLRQTAGSKGVRKYYSALRSAKRDLFLFVLDEIQKFWTSEKLIKITDDPEAGQVILNQEVRDPISGKDVIQNDLRLGKYDIKIDEDLETPNQRTETFNSLLELGKVALQAGQPFPVELLIKESSTPNKKEWLEWYQKLQQAQSAAAQAAQGGANPNGQLA